jgi:hypothetical protein
MPAMVDIAGHRFGKLIAVEKIGPEWRCVCDCGRETVRAAGLLRSGHTRSCGCLRREHMMGNRLSTRHGEAGRRTRTYVSWTSMMQRCHDERVPYFKNYGGRGIKVCARWHLYENFLADMGERPAGRSLDRFPNNDGDYEPGNCRWATSAQQARNRRVRPHS